MTEIPNLHRDVPLIGARKVIQIETAIIPGPPMWVDLPEGEEGPKQMAPGPTMAMLIALCDDGSLWATPLLGGANWQRRPGPPEHDRVGDLRG